MGRRIMATTARASKPLLARLPRRSGIWSSSAAASPAPVWRSKPHAAGWSVLLVEQRDFAWGTSSRSSKLVHGGLRYLKEGDLHLTTLHSVRERQRLMREAPGWWSRKAFCLPTAQRKPGRWLLQPA
jgi:hypothetical protein